MSDSEDAAPFASHAGLVFLAVAALFLALLYPPVGLPLFGVCVFLLVLRPARRFLARRR